MNETAASPSSTLDTRSREVILRNAYRLCRRRNKLRGNPLWLFVSEATGFGSTSSIQICKDLGWNPQALVGQDLPRA